jgi:hypothetical protein
VKNPNVSGLASEDVLNVGEEREEGTLGLHPDFAVAGADGNAPRRP